MHANVRRQNPAIANKPKIYKNSVKKRKTYPVCRRINRSNIRRNKQTLKVKSNNETRLVFLTFRDSTHFIFPHCFYSPKQIL